MKDSKTILKRHLFLTLAVQALFVIVIALPPLDPYRNKLAELTSFPTSAFWLPLLALLLVINVFIFRRLTLHFVKPLQDLYNQTKLSTTSIAFKKKSMNFEEDHLKHFIESQTLKSADLENEVTRMETEVERISQLAETSPDEIEALHAKAKAAADEIEKYSSKLADEQANSATLQKEVIELRKQIKFRNRELETLRGEAKMRMEMSETTPLSSILVERLKTPLSLVNNLAWRLAKSWDNTPPAQIREGLEEISRQSEEQLELLKRYEHEARDDRERDAL